MAKKQKELTIPIKSARKSQPRKSPRKTQRKSTPVQQTEYSGDDFVFQPDMDSTGLSVLTYYLGTLIHKFTLPSSDLLLWEGMQPQLRYNYVRLRVDPSCFGNDRGLIHRIILRHIDILNFLFQESHKVSR